MTKTPQVPAPWSKHGNPAADADDLKDLENQQPDADWVHDDDIESYLRQGWDETDEGTEILKEFINDIEAAYPPDLQDMLGAEWPDLQITYIKAKDYINNEAK